MDTQSVDVLAHLDTFYDHALDHILVTAGMVLAFVGGVGALTTTLTTALIQRRDFRNDKRDLESNINSQIASVEKAITEQVNSRLVSQEKLYEEKLETAISKYRKELNKEVMRARGAGFHVQALFCEGQGRLGEAARSIADAIEYYQKAEDGQNLSSAVRILKTYLPKIKKADFDNFHSLEKSINEAIEALGKTNVDGRFVDDIAELKKLRDAAKNSK